MNWRSPAGLLVSLLFAGDLAVTFGQPLGTRADGAMRLTVPPGPASDQNPAFSHSMRYHPPAWGRVVDDSPVGQRAVNGRIQPGAAGKPDQGVIDCGNLQP